MKQRIYQTILAITIININMVYGQSTEVSSRALLWLESNQPKYTHTISELEQYQRVLEDMVKYISISDERRFQSEIYYKKSLTTRNATLEIVEQVFALPNSMATLRWLDHLKSVDSKIWSSLKAEDQSMVKALLSEKEKEILSALSIEKTEERSSMVTNYHILKSLNSIYSLIDNEFSKFKENIQVDNWNEPKITQQSKSGFTNFNKTDAEILAVLEKGHLENSETRYMDVFPQVNEELMDSNTAQSIERNIEEKRQSTRDKVEKNSIKDFSSLITETKSIGEPSEAEMKSALGHLIKTITSTEKYKINFLDKYGCIKSQKKPGFVCDYAVNLTSSKKLSESIWGKSTTDQAIKIKTARYSKVKGEWMLVQHMND